MITVQVFGGSLEGAMFSPWVGAIFNALGCGRRPMVVSLSGLFFFFVGRGIGGDSAQYFFHLETYESHAGNHERLRSDHRPASLLKHRPREEAGLCLQPLDSRSLRIVFNGLNKS